MSLVDPELIKTVLLPGEEEHVPFSISDPRSLRSFEMASESSKHVPKSNTVANIYEHFGGCDLEDDNVSITDQNETFCFVEIPDENSNGGSAEQGGSIQPYYEESQESESESGRSVKKSGGFLLYFSFIKGFVTMNILFIPSAFENGGLVLSTIILLLVGVVNLLGVAQVIKCRGTFGGSYADIGYRASGKFGRVAVEFALAMTQAGFCIGFVCFIILNINRVFQLYNKDVNCLNLYSSIGCFIILLSISWVRKLSKLNKLHRIGDILGPALIIGIVGYSMYYISRSSRLEWNKTENKYWNIDKLMITLGIMVFAYQSIGVIIPLEEKMEDKSKFHKYMLGSSFTYMVITGILGVICYLAFALLLSNNQYKEIGLVTLILPLDGIGWWKILIIALILLYAASLLPRYAFSVYPIYRIQLQIIFGRLSLSQGGRKWVKGALRIINAFITCLLAYYAAHYLIYVVTLIAALFSIPLSLILPGWFHYTLFATESLGRINCLLDLFLLLFGLTAMVYIIILTFIAFYTT